MFAEVRMFECCTIVHVNDMIEENAAVSIRIYQIEYSYETSAFQILTTRVRSQFQVSFNWLGIGNWELAIKQL